jgi:hypothetical protein
MTPEAIVSVWRSNVSRFHSHPDHRLRRGGDETQAHTARCIQLLLALNPLATMDQVRALAFHDTAEDVVGDTPGPAKRRFPALRAALYHAEAEVQSERFGRVLDLDDPWVDFTDKLDALLFAVSRGVVWPKDEPHLRHQAVTLHCGGTVAAMIDVLRSWSQ